MEMNKKKTANAHKIQLFTAHEAEKCSFVYTYAYLLLLSITAYLFIYISFTMTTK